MAPLVEPETEFEAEYALETAVTCAHCKASLEALRVVRLLRRRVNFTSSLPRRGYVVVCPKCQTMVPAVVGTGGLT
jgi:ssDNA-binding Zn-finger/Zn-ribbon topoisomerase 1